MALLDVHFFSKALQVQVSTLVILPEENMGIGVTAGAGDRLPQVLYLLHGYSDDHTIWLRRTSVERYAAAHQLAVVMPAVNHSFYTNEVQGERYWDYVSEELPGVMHGFFRLSDQPEDTYVCGLSMGGYGAMKLALRHPERFAAAASFSGVLDIADMSRRTHEASAGMARVFGDLTKLRGSENDLFRLLMQNEGAPHKPRLYVSCGTADFLYGHHGKFCREAVNRGWQLQRHDEPDASHEWSFWDSQVEYFLRTYVR